MTRLIQLEGFRRFRHPMDGPFHFHFLFSLPFCCARETYENFQDFLAELM